MGRLGSLVDEWWNYWEIYVAMGEPFGYARVLDVMAGRCA